MQDTKRGLTEESPSKTRLLTVFPVALKYQSFSKKSFFVAIKIQMRPGLLLNRVSGPIKMTIPLTPKTSRETGCAFNMRPVTCLI